MAAEGARLCPDRRRTGSAGLKRTRPAGKVSWDAHLRKGPPAATASSEAEAAFPNRRERKTLLFRFSVCFLKNLLKSQVFLVSASPA